MYHCIWSKRLEQGLFARRSPADTVRVSLSQTEFAALIEGFGSGRQTMQETLRKACVNADKHWDSDHLC